MVGVVWVGLVGLGWLVGVVGRAVRACVCACVHGAFACTPRTDTHSVLGKKRQDADTGWSTHLLPPREAPDLAVGAELLREPEVVQVLLDHLGDERPVLRCVGGWERVECIFFGCRGLMLGLGGVDSFRW